MARITTYDLVACDIIVGGIPIKDGLVSAEIAPEGAAFADEILVLNVGGYFGDSTRSEIAYARRVGKCVRWLEQSPYLCGHCRGSGRVQGIGEPKGYMIECPACGGTCFAKTSLSDSPK